jgi:hypothetical protein
MENRPMPPVEEIRALVGHQFPGGTYTIQHWENFLLTECTGTTPLPNGQVHPAAMFHVPILGANTTIGEMFELGQAENDASIGIESYDWELFKPLYEDVAYDISARISEADRVIQDDGRTYDRIQFIFTLKDPEGENAARSTVTWHYNRSRALMEK